MNTSVPEFIHGRYFAVGTSASLDAELFDRDGQLVIKQVEGGEEHLVEFHVLGDRLGNLPRKLYFTDQSVFETTDNDGVDAAFGLQGKFGSQLVRAEGSVKFIVFAVVATVLALAGLYRYGLPAAASFAAWATPPAAVALIDASALDTVDRVMFSPSSMEEAEQKKYLAVFDELVVASRQEDLPLRLLFRDGGRLGANAVALPGGTIILTDQLAALSENEDEIAGVLAHEIGHVTEMHSLRQIYRALGLGFMAAVVIGDTSQLIDNVAGQVALLDTLSYSRKFEIDADTTSVEIMLNAKRDPMAFVDLLDRIFEDAGVDTDKDTSWLSTHPGNEDRRKNVQRLIDNLQK